MRRVARHGQGRKGVSRAGQPRMGGDKTPPYPHAPPAKETAAWRGELPRIEGAGALDRRREKKGAPGTGPKQGSTLSQGKVVGDSSASAAGGGGGGGRATAEPVVVAGHHVVHRAASGHEGASWRGRGGAMGAEWGLLARAAAVPDLAC